MPFNAAVQNLIAQKQSGMAKMAPNAAGMKGVMKADMPQPRVAPSPTMEAKARKKLQMSALAGR